MNETIALTIVLRDMNSERILRFPVASLQAFLDELDSPKRFISMELDNRRVVINKDFIKKVEWLV